MRRAGVVLLAALLLSGCAAAGVDSRPQPTTPPVTPSATPSASNTPRVPDDGVPLTQLGFAHGPAYFSVPRGALIATASDQEATVTLVITRPSADVLVSYYDAALPAAGFTITGRRVEATDATLSFAGGGWSGVLTGRGGDTGITLRRAG